MRGFNYSIKQARKQASKVSAQARSALQVFNSSWVLARIVSAVIDHGIQGCLLRLYQYLWLVLEGSPRQAGLRCCFWHRQNWWCSPDSSPSAALPPALPSSVVGYTTLDSRQWQHQSIAQQRPPAHHVRLQHQGRNKQQCPRAGQGICGAWQLSGAS
jgi:hypothetical protein